MPVVRACIYSCSSGRLSAPAKTSGKTASRRRRKPIIFPETIRFRGSDVTYTTTATRSRGPAFVTRTSPFLTSRSLRPQYSRGKTLCAVSFQPFQVIAVVFRTPHSCDEVIWRSSQSGLGPQKYFSIRRDTGTRAHPSGAGPRFFLLMHGVVPVIAGNQADSEPDQVGQTN